jgi:hypothetical protein
MMGVSDGEAWCDGHKEMRDDEAEYEVVVVVVVAMVP